MTETRAVSLSTDPRITGVDTVADLRALGVDDWRDIIRLKGSASVGDGLPRDYYWSATSTATDDGDAVLKPDALGGASPGRWLKLTDATSTVLGAFATVSALRAVPVANVGTGYSAYVTARGHGYLYSATSTAADDGAAVLRPDSVSSGAAGRWLRDPTTDPAELTNRSTTAQADARYAIETDSITTLRATTGAVGGQIRYVKGYYGAGTGGGGMFRADSADTTTADNGITVFVDAGGMRHKRDWDGIMLSPLAAGCRVDDSTNDTANMQALVDFFYARGGGAIAMTLGTMRANVVLKDYVTIFGGDVRAGMAGASPPCKLRGVLGVTGWVVDTPAAACIGPRLVGVHVIGHGATDLGGVLFRQVKYGTVASCVFTNLGNNAIKKTTMGFSAYGNGFRDNFAQNCLLVRTRTQVDGVIDLDGTDDWVDGGEYTPSLISGKTSYATDTGTAQAGASTSITLRSGARTGTNTYLGVIEITGGTGVGQVRYVSAYNGTTKVATVTVAWTTIPDATSTYAVYGPLSDTSGTGHTTTTFVLSANESAVDNEYNGFVVEITSGTLILMSNLITSYVGATRTATMKTPWAAAPAANVTYRIYPARCAAMVLRGTEIRVRGTVTEIADVGVHLDTLSSPGNFLTNVRADLNSGPGFLLSGLSFLTTCNALRNGQNQNNAYDGFLEILQTNSILNTCKSSGISADAARPRYGFNHSTALGAASKTRNLWPIGDNNVTALVKQYSNNSSTVFVPVAAPTLHTAAGGTIAMEGYSSVNVATAGTVTDVTGIVQGQDIVIYAQVAGVVLAHLSGSGTGAKFSFPEAVNLTLVLGQAYRFVFNANALRPVRDVGAAGGTSTQSGTGAQTAFTIAHGLGFTPTVFQVTPGAVAAAAPFFVTADATNLTVTFSTAPASGTNNVVLRWSAR